MTTSGRPSLVPLKEHGGLFAGAVTNMPRPPFVTCHALTSSFERGRDPGHSQVQQSQEVCERGPHSAVDVVTGMVIRVIIWSLRTCMVGGLETPSLIRQKKENREA